MDERKQKNHIWDRLDSTKQPHFLEDCPSWPIVGSAGWTLQGHSVAGERTGFHIPELRLFLDGGMNSFKSVKCLLLTHSHSDHSHNLPCVAMGQGGNLSQRPLVYCPTPMVSPLQLLSRASQALNDCRELSERDEMNIRGVSLGETFTILCGRNANVKVIVDVVECVHTVPSIGYILSTETTKLLPELEGVAPQEIRKRAKANEPTTMKVKKQIVAFLGDTTIAVFERNPSLLSVPVIIIECTAVDDNTSAEKMRERGHIHWNDLFPVIEKNPQTFFVLIHFSQALSEKEVLKRICSHGLSNILIWFDSGVVDVGDLLREN